MMIVVMAMAIIAIATTLKVGNEPSTYNKEMLIVETNGKMVTAIDENGEEWQFFADGIQVGDKIVATVKDCGTEKIADDYIIDIM